MKRLVLAGAVTVLCFAACGSVARTASMKATIAGRQSVAAQEAHALLGRFVPPPEAVPLHGLRDYGPSEMAPDAAMKVNRFVGWRVPLSFTAAVQWMHTHRPNGFAWDGSGSTGGRSGIDSRSIDWYRGYDYLEASVTRGARGVTMRVDSTAIWVYPRPSEEKVPSAVREVDIRSAPNPHPDPWYTAPEVSLRVTDSAKVAQIIRWFDALPVIPPGSPKGGCSLGPLPDDDFVFRSAEGTELARARVPIGLTGVCDWMDFSIAGKNQLAVVDKYLGHTGPSFVDRVEKLLSVRLRPG